MSTVKIIGILIGVVGLVIVYFETDRASKSDELIEVSTLLKIGIVSMGISILMIV